MIVDASLLINFIASIIIPVILFIVTQSAARGARERREIIDKLDGIRERLEMHETRITVLEERWYDFDEHSSKPRRPRS